MLGIDPRAARATWTVILIALLCLVIYAIRHTLFIFIVSLLFAYLLLPIVDFIDRVLPLKRSRTPALAIVYLVLACLFFFAVYQPFVHFAKLSREAVNHRTKVRK